MANGVDRVDAVVFTHGHADHVCGLDDCRRFNALRGGPLDVWADDATHESLNRMFPYAFLKPGEGDVKLFRPALVPRTIDGDFTIGRMNVDAGELPAQQRAGPGLPRQPRRRSRLGLLHRLQRGAAGRPRRNFAGSICS